MTTKLRTQMRTKWYKMRQKNKVRIYEHRFIMEEFLGRKLEDGEEVHHIDGDRQNNKIENLQVMSNIDHRRLHAEQNKFNKYRLGLAPVNKTPREVENKIKSDRLNKAPLKDLVAKYNLSYPTIQRICKDIKIRVHNYSEERRNKISQRMIGNSYAAKNKT